MSATGKPCPGKSLTAFIVSFSSFLLTPLLWYPLRLSRHSINVLYYWALKVAYTQDLDQLGVSGDKDEIFYKNSEHYKPAHWDRTRWHSSFLLGSTLQSSLQIFISKLPLHSHEFSLESCYEDLITSIKIKSKLRRQIKWFASARD